MMENVMQEPRLLQIFLSPTIKPGPGIYEVSLTADQTFICTCPGYHKHGACKHISFVQKKVKSNNGAYPLELSTRSKEVDTDKIMESSESFREFIIKYGKIEVC